MNRDRAPSNGGATLVLPPLLLANAGVLVVFIFGPNGPHPMLPLAYGGVAVAVAGAVLIVRALIVRRRAADAPNARRR
jgi:hypothetical protein